MLKAGFSRTDITPEPGVRLGGYGTEHRPAKNILDPLHSTALALRQGGVTALVVNLDWLAIEEETVQQLRTLITQATGVKSENITLSTIHTHSAPNTLDFWGWGKVEQQYVDKVSGAIVESCRQALDNLTEVAVGFAETKTKVGINRRRLNMENKPCLSPGDEHGSYDPYMTVVHFKDREQKSIGIIVHCSAHCTALNGKDNMNRVSRDWVGIMKDRIESLLDAPVLFMNGAIGDAAPRSNNMLSDKLSAAPEGIHQMREVGYRAATDATQALVGIKEWRKDLKLELMTEEILLPYAPLSSLEEAKEQMKALEPQKDKWGGSMCNYRHSAAVVEAHGKAPVPGKKYLQTITVLGPLAIVPFPGELFSQISLRIRRFSPFRYTLCASVTNGSLGYIVTKEARTRGGYEPWVGRAKGAYLLADNIDDVLVETSVRQLNDLKQRKH